MSKATKIDKIIGAKIELHRKINKKGRIWLSKKIGKSYQQVQKYENGKNRVSASTLLEISKFLKTPIIEFFPDKNDKRINKLEGKDE